MSLLINLLCADTACTTAALPAGINRCVMDAVTTSGECFIFMKCDYQFSDVTDVAEWELAQTNGDVVISPAGFWGKAVPTETSFDITCSEKFQTQEGDQFVFESYLLKLDDLADQTFYKELRANYAAYKVIPVTCDGQFLVTDDYLTATTVAEESPGFDFSWVVSPNYEIVSGPNNPFKWTFTMQIGTPDIICRRYLPGVKEALTANQ